MKAIFGGLVVLAAILAMLGYRSSPDVHAADNICRATLILDRSGSIKDSDMSRMQQDIKKLFGPGGINDNNIALSFWSFANSDSQGDKLSNNPPNGLNNYKYNTVGYGFVGTDQSIGDPEYSKFAASIDALKETGGGTNYEEGFAYKNGKLNGSLGRIPFDSEIVLFFSDGRPHYGTDEQTAVEDGRKAAAKLKNTGTKKQMVGIFLNSQDPEDIKTMRYVINGNKNKTTDENGVQNIFSFNNFAVGDFIKNQISERCKPPQPKCTIDITENVPGDPAGQYDVKAAEQFDVKVNISNTSGSTLDGSSNDLTLRVDGWRDISASSADVTITGSGDPKFLQSIAPGETKTANFKATAPNSIIEAPFDVTINYQGADLGNCQTNVRTFKQFELSPNPSVQLFGDNEDPDRAEFKLIAQSSPDVEIGYSAKDYYERYGDPTQTVFVDESGTKTTPNLHEHTELGLPAPEAGGKYCMDWSVAHLSGWSGPGGLVGASTPGRSGTECAKVENRPYLRVYGGDVYAGNSTDSNCFGSGDEMIKTYVSAKANKSGSGTQLAAYAQNDIEQFISGSLRNVLDQENTNLTFANTGAGVGPYGGKLGLPVCATNYWATKDETAPASNGNLAGIEDKSGKFYDGSSITLHGSSNLSGQKAVYVNGDVYIDGNITYKSDYGSSVNSIPRFALIASGSIYISGDVTNLDGLYVANGKISTCAKPGESYPKVELWDKCRSALTINGNFMAPKIDFLRSIGSLRDSRRGASGDGATRANAAEIFFYGPEVFLAPLINGNTTGGTEFNGSPARYDAFTTLPPVL